jgi:hypothetical protein
MLVYTHMCGEVNRRRGGGVANWVCYDIVRASSRKCLFIQTHSLFVGKKSGPKRATRRNNYCDTDTKAMQEADGDDTFENLEEKKLMPA